MHPEVGKWMTAQRGLNGWFLQGLSRCSGLKGLLSCWRPRECVLSQSKSTLLSWARTRKLVILSFLENRDFCTLHLWTVPGTVLIESLFIRRSKGRWKPQDPPSLSSLRMNLPITQQWQGVAKPAEVGNIMTAHKSKVRTYLEWSACHCFKALIFPNSLGAVTIPIL